MATRRREPGARAGAPHTQTQAGGTMADALKQAGVVDEQGQVASGSVGDAEKKKKKGAQKSGGSAGESATTGARKPKAGTPVDAVQSAQNIGSRGKGQVAGDGRPKRERREAADPLVWQNVKLVPDRHSPGDYIVEQRKGRDRCVVRVVGVGLLPTDKREKQTIRLLAEPKKIAPNDFRAEAIIHGASVDTTAIERVRKAKPAHMCGEVMSTGKRVVTEIEPGLYSVDGAEIDNRTVSIRSIMGWAPETLDVAGQHIAQEDNFSLTLIEGGKGTIAYEAVPTIEARFVQKYTRFINVLARYKEAMRALAHTEGFHDVSGDMIPWNSEDANSKWAKRVRELIGNGLKAVLSDYAQDITDITQGKNSVHETASENNIDQLIVDIEQTLQKNAPFFHADVFPREQEMNPDALRTEDNELVDAVYRICVNTFGESGAHTHDDVKKLMETGRCALEKLPDSFVNRALRGDEAYAYLQSALIEKGLPPLKFSDGLIIAGETRVVDGKPVVQDLAEALRVGTRLGNIRVEYRDGEYIVVCDTVLAREMRQAEYMRARREGREYEEKENHIAIALDDFIAFVRAGEIEVQREGAISLLERLHAQLEAATPAECVEYVNGRSAHGRFVQTFEQLRAGATSGPDQRALFDAALRGVLIKMKGYVVDTLGIQIDNITFDRQDLKTASIELRIRIGSKEFPVSLTGNVQSDTQALNMHAEVIAAARAEKAAAEKAEKTKALYAFIDTAPMQQVVDFIEGDVLSRPGIPDDLRTYRNAIHRGGPEVATALRDKILARVRAHVSVAADIEMKPYTSSPFQVELFLGKERHIFPITGDKKKDAEAYAPILAKLNAERQRIEHETSQPQVLERMNAYIYNKWPFYPPITLGEELVISHLTEALPAGLRLRIEKVHEHAEGMYTLECATIPTGEAQVISLSEVLSFVAARTVLEPDHAYLIKMGQELDVLYERPAEALGYAGFPKTEIGGNTLYRCTLAAPVVDMKQGETVRILKFKQGHLRGAKVQICEVGVERPDGTLSERTCDIVLSDIVKNPQWFERPVDGMYTRLARALGLTTPEQAQKILTVPGALRMQNAEGQAGGRLTGLVIIGNNVSYFQGGVGRSQTRTIDEFIAAINAGSIVFSTDADEAQAIRDQKTHPVVEPMYIGGYPEYRLRCFLGHDYKAFLDGNMYLVEDMGDDEGEQYARITVQHRDADGVELSYDPELNHSPARLTYEAILMAYAQRRFVTLDDRSEASADDEPELGPMPGAATYTAPESGSQSQPPESRTRFEHPEPESVIAPASATAPTAQAERASQAVTVEEVDEEDTDEVPTDHYASRGGNWSRATRGSDYRDPDNEEDSDKEVIIPAGEPLQRTPAAPEGAAKSPWPTPPPPAPVEWLIPDPTATGQFSRSELRAPLDAELAAAVGGVDDRGRENHDRWVIAWRDMMVKKIELHDRVIAELDDIKNKMSVITRARLFFRGVVIDFPQLSAEQREQYMKTTNQEISEELSEKILTVVKAIVSITKTPRSIILETQPSQDGTRNFTANFHIAP